MSARKSISVTFISPMLAIDEAAAFELFRLDKSNPKAAKKAWYRIRAANGIKPVPGTTNRWWYPQLERLARTR